MIRSTDRILTTHAGALPRSAELTGLIRQRATRQPVDDARIDSLLDQEVRQVLRLQAEHGVDSVSDGEFSKANFTHYAAERIGGIELREYDQGQGPDPLSIVARDDIKFSDYFAAGFGGFTSRDKGTAKRKIRQRFCTSALKYIGHDTVARDIKRLRASLAEVPAAEAFLPSVTPGVIEHWLFDEIGAMPHHARNHRGARRQFDGLEHIPLMFMARVGCFNGIAGGLYLEKDIGKLLEGRSNSCGP